MLIMDKQSDERILKQLMWDYNIPLKDIEAVLKGEKEYAGHYNREQLFKKILESFPWFTVLQLFTPEEILIMLTPDLIGKLKTPSLRKNYTYVRHRLQEIIQAAG
jgi:hypothetical protein